MNPTSNKSDFEDLTTSLKDLAYSYLEKYSPSKQQLKVYLLKKYLTKIKGTKSKKEVTSLLDFPPFIFVRYFFNKKTFNCCFDGLYFSKYE